MYITLRNDEQYPYSNLFLIAEMTGPDGASERDTLEYEMADASGNWMGTGYGSVKENKLWYRENIVFPDSGVYTVTVSHAMRKNGSVEGILELPGVLDVGLQIEKNQ
jgi:gliding motility-associated lipoprotein GldH